MNIKENLIMCFKNLGVELDNSENDIDLREYFEDSLMFISAIVEIENFFDIEIPEELLLYDKFSSINSFSLELKELIDTH